MNNHINTGSHLKPLNTEHLYGYCACPIPLANEQITASQRHRYHLTVIQPDGCDPPMDNCVWLITYEMSLDEAIDFIRHTDDQILSIERIHSE